jgi:hypothetical protein
MGNFQVIKEKGIAVHSPTPPYRLRVRPSSGVRAPSGADLLQTIQSTGIIAGSRTLESPSCDRMVNAHIRCEEFGSRTEGVTVKKIASIYGLTTQKYRGKYRPKYHSDGSRVISCRKAAFCACVGESPILSATLSRDSPPSEHIYPPYTRSLLLREGRGYDCFAPRVDE